MDANQILALQPLLSDYLSHFDACLPHSQTRGHLEVYVRGQPSDLPRKSVEPIALQAEVAPCTVQRFCLCCIGTALSWDCGYNNSWRRSMPACTALESSDDTGCPKKGTRTPGVKRQYCEATGKLDNRVVSVHLSYAAEDFHCLVDNELCLPEEWSEDRPRCRAAGIPHSVVYRPKWRIVREQYQRALANEIHFEWLTFDEPYDN